MTPPNLIHDTLHDSVNFTVPQGACDCHTHVFGPTTTYPLAMNRVYTPGQASVASLLALQQHLHLGRVVVVQPSPYAADNACTVDALLEMGGRARGVAVIDEATTDVQLQALHDAGVRGIRLNLETGGIHDPVAAAQQLRWASERVASLGWHLQLYTNLAVLAALQDVIRSLPNPVVIDHFGGAQAASGSGQLHFDVLLQLVREGNVWVKLSAPHRISSAPDCQDAGTLVSALVAANSDRMLWGSDWPHPGPKPGVARSPLVTEVFNQINDGRALNRLAEWVNDEVTLRKILVDNPARLYDFDQSGLAAK